MSASSREIPVIDLFADLHIAGATAPVQSEGPPIPAWRAADVERLEREDYLSEKKKVKRCCS